MTEESPTHAAAGGSSPLTEMTSEFRTPIEVSHLEDLYRSFREQCAQAHQAYHEAVSRSHEAVARTQEAIAQCHEIIQQGQETIHQSRDAIQNSQETVAHAQDAMLARANELFNNVLTQLQEEHDRIVDEATAKAEVIVTRANAFKAENALRQRKPLNLQSRQGQPHDEVVLTPTETEALSPDPAPPQPTSVPEQPANLPDPAALQAAAVSTQPAQAQPPSPSAEPSAPVVAEAAPPQGNIEPSPSSNPEALAAVPLVAESVAAPLPPIVPPAPPSQAAAPAPVQEMASQAPSAPPQPQIVPEVTGPVTVQAPPPIASPEAIPPQVPTGDSSLPNSLQATPHQGNAQVPPEPPPPPSVPEQPAVPATPGVSQSLPPLPEHLQASQAAQQPPLADASPQMAPAGLAPNPIADYVAQRDPSDGSAPSTTENAPVEQDAPITPLHPAPGASAPEGNASEAQELAPREAVLNVIAQKTGYPVEMLLDHLQSHTVLEFTPPKVIEVFNAISDYFPHAPKLDLNQFGKLTKLAQLVHYLCDEDAEAPAAKAQPASEPTSSPFEVAQAAPPAADQAPGVFSAANVAEGAAADSPFQALPDTPPSAGDSPFHLAAADTTESASSEPTTPFQAVGEQTAPQTPFQAAPAQLVESSPFQPVDQPPAGNPPQEGVQPDFHQAEVESPEPASAQSPIPEEADVVVERFVSQGQVAAPCGLGLPQTHLVEKIHILPDDLGVGDAMKDLFASQGIQAEIVSEVPATSSAMIVLSGLKPAGTIEEAMAIQLEAFQAAKAVAHGTTQRPGLFVTVQDTGGDFGTSSTESSRAWLGGLPGLARTVAAERPEVGVKALDLEREGRSPEVLALQIIKEISEGGPEVEVGLSADGTRLSQTLHRADLRTGGDFQLPEDAVILVHGVGQPVISAPLLELAQRRKMRFVLLGSVVNGDSKDDPVPDLRDADEIRQALVTLAQQQGETLTPDAIEQRTQCLLAQKQVHFLTQSLTSLGSTVCYFCLDSTNPKAVEMIVAQVRTEWGDISGIIHCNGVTQDARLEQKTSEQFSAVLNANLRGAENLLEATQHDPLQLICFLSPSMHQASPAGHADYAMANEIINKTACAEARRRGGKCVVRSINWSFWDDGVISDSAKASLQQQRGVTMIPQCQAGRLFVDELGNGVRSEVEVILGPQLTSSTSMSQVSNYNALIQVLVGKATTPNFADHQIQGLAAVPAVGVMEWFMRNGRQIMGSRGIIRCRDLRQVQGIALPEFDTVSAAFSIVMDSVNDFQMGGPSPIRLLDADGQLRYSAIIDTVPDQASLRLEAAPELELERTAWTGSHVYGPGALFHGSAFQVIHRVEGVSPQGALGRLLPPEDAVWPSDLHEFHPAMIDGAAQLAFVWGLFTQDSEFLPTSIGEFVQVPHANYSQGLRCVLQGIETTAEKLVFNVFIEDDDNQPVATLRNVTCHPVSTSSG